MTRYTLTVPLQDNYGSSAADVLDDVEYTLAAQFRGYTRTDSVGGYIGDDGQRYREPVAVYTVDTPAVDARGILLALADFVRGALAQEAVYLTEAPIVVTLITAETVEV